MNIHERYLVTDPTQKPIATALYETAAHLPLVCPHGHVDPHLFADPAYHFGNPVDLLIRPDHYVLRILHSQGVSYAKFGIPSNSTEEVEANPLKVWQIFAEHFYLFDATPTGIWLKDELQDIFAVEEKLNGKNAQRIYDQISGQLESPDFSPRKLYERFGIEVLCTTDSAGDTLKEHQAIRASGWRGKILPTFRPDAIINIDQPDWLSEIARLSLASKIEIVDFASYIRAIEDRRAFFKSLGATATDQAVLTVDSQTLSPKEVNSIFQKALKKNLTGQETRQFIAHMINEMARMSTEDGLVMQLHVGSLRDHDQTLYNHSGPDLGADFPIQTEFTRSLQPLLNRFGNHPNFTLILFTLDESTYARELAPLAGYYPALKLGPPWWFHDSLNGMERFFDQVMESCGLYNTVGFNDDTRAFLSIPTRHDLWRRASANWLAGLVARQIVNIDEAQLMMEALACGLARKAYHLDK